MSAKQVHYHEGAATDVKSAVAWYQKRSRKAALDFMEELERAANAICDAPERWPIRGNNTRQFLLWKFPFVVIYSADESANQLSPSGLSRTEAGGLSIGCNG